MRQLTLNVRPPIECRLDNFIVGDNADLLAALRQQIGRDDGSVLYLWGSSGSGRSHLLRAAVAAADMRPAYYAAGSTESDISLSENGLLAVDGVEVLGDAAQSSLFRVLIGAKAARASLVMAGNSPPNQLPLRDDVGSRIAQGLIFEIKPLSDQHKAATLMQHARSRGMHLGAEIINYLLRHGRRDLPWLMAVLDALDEASLSLGRPVTLPLLRDVLNNTNTAGPKA